MLGRRRHVRFEFSQPPAGSLRLRRDVTIHDGTDGTLAAVGHAPGVVGEVLSLHIWGGGEAASLQVEVVDTRPQLVDGVLMHTLRLLVLSSRSAAESGSAS